jgi:hypothetical protein
MAVNNQTIYAQGQVDFRPLEQMIAVLGLPMRFTDSDQEHERHGYTLRFEWKWYNPDEGTPGIHNRSQEIGHKTRVAHGHTFAVFLWWHDETGVPEYWQVVGTMTKPQRCSLDKLAALCVDWRRHVDEVGRPQVVEDSGGIWVRYEPYRYDSRRLRQLTPQARAA